MSRLKRPEVSNANANPVKKFLEWKSNDQNFQWYDKATCRKKGVELPLKVLFLEHYHTVKGWSDSANSGIWSNEVFNSRKEEVTVRNANGVIATGIYNEMKDTIKNAGGVYYRSVYCMTPEGEIINLQLKGAALGGLNAETSVDKTDVLGWSTFYGGDRKKNIKGVSHLLDNQWIEIKEAKGGKKGAVKFSIPHFEVGEVITRDEDKLANEAANKLQTYMDQYFAKEVEEIEVEAEVVEADLSDLAF